MIQVVKIEMYDRAYGDRVSLDVEVIVDIPAIARWLGPRAFANKSGRARALGGTVIVGVLPKSGGRKEVKT